MNTRDESAASDVSGQPEPEKQATEQSKPEIKSFQDLLLEGAEAEGYEIGEPKPEPEPEAEAEPDVESEAKPPAEGEDSKAEPEPEPAAPEETKEEESEEELKPAAEKGDKLVPLGEVLEERAKKKRANERAEKAEALAAQLQQQLAQASAPVPTEANPFIDIQDVNALDKLEQSYESAIELADSNIERARETGEIEVAIGKNPDGTDKIQTFTTEQLVAVKRKAEKAIRKQIPDRRTYLQQRAVYDSQVMEAYPELKNPESELTRNAAALAQSILTGKAQNDPTLLIWIVRAVKGWQAEVQRNGKETPEVKSTEAKQILNSARQKIAPTPTRTRSISERRSSSDLAKTQREFKEKGDEESADKYIETLLSQRSRANKLEPIAE